MTGTIGEPDLETAARRRAEDLYAKDRTCELLGIDLRDAGPGRATVGMRVAETMVNGHGTGHGGFLFLLADAAFAFACNTHGPATVAQGRRSPSSARPRWATTSSRRRWSAAGSAAAVCTT
ncbi:hotdog fold thioesterase [Streptomyces sp. NBC_01362]|uniref:hotdog fold thioesterase n=1 Tax=Streptomyces sp. NBC_01362 TaxID=2903839 RepID=UPI003FCE3DBA